MKHTPKVTFILLGLFLLAQLLGLAIVYSYVDVEKSALTGKTEFAELPIGERPPLEERTSYIPLMLAILVGTVVLLFLVRHNLTWIWKAWFFIAVGTALVVAFNAFIPTVLAAILAIVLAAWKVFKPNFVVHTGTELFVYGGLAAIFVPLFTLWSISILLVLIAIYDAYAVWKSKHMITLAKSQADSKMFAGLLIPYQFSLKNKELSSKVHSHKLSSKVPIPPKVRTAMLGGGDIAFPLLFAGVVLKEWGVWQSFVIPFFALGGLGYLLYTADQKKFYPAMPFIAAACFIGLGVVWLLGLLL